MNSLILSIIHSFILSANHRAQYCNLILQFFIFFFQLINLLLHGAARWIVGRKHVGYLAEEIVFQSLADTQQQFCFYGCTFEIAHNCTVVHIHIARPCSLHNSFLLYIGFYQVSYMYILSVIVFHLLKLNSIQYCHLMAIKLPSGGNSFAI
jgi:hypothetical protein